MREALDRLPVSDWVRIWATLRARHLPVAIARQIQVSIAEQCVRSMTIVGSAAAVLTLVLAIGKLPYSADIRPSWIAVHLTGYALMFAAMGYLWFHLRRRTLSAAKVNWAMLPSALIGSINVGLLPYMLYRASGNHDQLVTATPVVALYVMVGFFWPFGHWPLSVVYVSSAMGVGVGSYAVIGFSEGWVFGVMAVVGLAILIALSGLISGWLVRSRYYTIVAGERQQLLGLLFDELDEAGFNWLWETDEAGRLCHVPARMIAAAHGDPRVAPGAPIDALLPVDAKQLYDQRARVSVDIFLSGDDGSGEMRLVGIPNKTDGGASGYRGFGTDVRAARESARAERVSERLDVLVGLTAGLTHHVNNMLASMLTSVELAGLDSGVSTPTHDHLERAMAAVLRTRRITNDLAVAAGHAGSYVPTAINVADAARDAVAELQPRFAPIEVTVVEHQPTWVLSDPVHFQRAVGALVQNGCEAIELAGGDGGHVQVIIDQYDPTPDDSNRQSGPIGPLGGPVARVRVRDSGPGLGEADVDRLFEPFYSTRRATGGVGLGLSIARGVALQAMGALSVADVDRVEGSGAEFTMMLPATVASEHYSAPPTEASAAAVPMDGGRVVVVEDDRFVADSLSEWLSAAGATVAHAASVSEAIQQFRGRTSDVVCALVDVRLPDGDGYAVVDALRAVDPNLRVIYVSGFADTVPAQHDRRRWAPMLAKPFTVAELGAVLSSVGVIFDAPGVSTVASPMSGPGTDGTRVSG